MQRTDAVLRIEVSDTRGERRPPSPGRLTRPATTEDSGRGLLLVDALADRWTVLDRVPIGKTVRAELDLIPLSATPHGWTGPQTGVCHATLTGAGRQD